MRGVNMAGVTYKCPSCGGYLNFEPDSQRWKCPFCDSVFAQNELADRDSEYEEQPAEASGENQPEGEASQQEDHYAEPSSDGSSQVT